MEFFIPLAIILVAHKIRARGGSWSTVTSFVVGSTTGSFLVVTILLLV
ncbi:MAG: hypothetical protein G01um101420_382 [Parcubacteria group bacterium Gr01-1014_20]|nr:MAG: hypothetical protein G01um101420_382 [Parcubacteria group bacterium Gr01-1014_20]